MEDAQSCSMIIFKKKKGKKKKNTSVQKKASLATATKKKVKAMINDNNPDLADCFEWRVILDMALVLIKIVLLLNCLSLHAALSLVLFVFCTLLFLVRQHKE